MALIVSSKARSLSGDCAWRARSSQLDLQSVQWFEVAVPDLQGSRQGRVTFEERCDSQHSENPLHAAVVLVDHELEHPR